MTRFSRYTLISILGLSLDASLVFGLTLINWPFELRIAIGYGCALLFTYLLHEYYTYASGQRSLKRGSGYLLITVLVGLLRIPLSTLGLHFISSETLAWTGAVGITFLLNFVLLSWWLGRSAPPHPLPAPSQDEQP